MRQQKHGRPLILIAVVLLMLAAPSLVFAVAVELKENVVADEIPGAELFLTQDGTNLNVAEPPEFARFISEMFNLDPDLGLQTVDKQTLESWIEQYDAAISELEAQRDWIGRIYCFLFNAVDYFKNPTKAIEIAASWYAFSTEVDAAIETYQSERDGYGKALAKMNNQSADGGGGDGEGEGEGCFQAETRVLLADGCAVEISKIKVGEMVKSFNVQNGRMEDKEVLELYSFPTRGYYVINGTLKATEKHPFLIADSGGTWKKASELAVGDKIQSTDSIVTVESIEFMTEEGVAYNFLVKDNKAYIVSSGDKYYVVHNGL